MDNFCTGTVSGCITPLATLGDLSCDLPRVGSLWFAVMVLLGDEAGAGESGAVK